MKRRVAAEPSPPTETWARGPESEEDGAIAYANCFQIPGSKPAQPLLLEGLKRLEYRGYDSAGRPRSWTPPARSTSRKRRAASPISKPLLAKRGPLSGTMGMCHTRWATHGGVTDINAHPHRNEKSGIVVIQRHHRELRRSQNVSQGKVVTVSFPRRTPKCSPR